MKKREDFDFGPKMKKARLEAGISQVKLGAMLKCAQPNIAKMESVTSNPTYATMQKIAEALGCTIEFIPKKGKK